MPSTKAAEDAPLDPYAVLGIEVTATDAEIRRAYRSLSLKLHPDKARDVDADVASQRFHALHVAYEQLADPAVRARYKEAHEVESARSRRRQAYEGHRKRMADELEADEEQARSRQQGEAKRAREQAQRLAQLKERGRQMRQEVERRVRQEQDDVVAGQEQRQQHRQARSHPAVSGDNQSRTASVPEPPTPKAAATSSAPTLPRVGSKKKVDTEAATRSSASTSASASAPSAATHAPPPPQPPTTQSSSSSAPRFSFSLGSLGRRGGAPDPSSSKEGEAAALDFEGATLLRLREAERKRLERQIREQEARE